MAKRQGFEHVNEGESFDHHWGRTFTESDVVLFSAASLHYNRSTSTACWPSRLATSANPSIRSVFLTTFGLSVEDLSEIGGYFLGVDELTYHEAVHVGDTITAHSTVISARASTSRPALASSHGIPKAVTRPDGRWLASGGRIWSGARMGREVTEPYMTQERR